LANVGSLNLMPLSAGLIIIPCSLWFAFVGPRLAGMAGGVVATPILLLTMLLSLACLITAWITEPGIVPYVALEEEETPESSEEADGHTTLQRNAPKKKLYVIALNGQHYPLPMFRAKICRETEACIERFDHFCPWIGNVVGVRNHKYFVLFTVFTFAVAVEVFISSVVIGTADPHHFKIPTHERAVALTLMSYTVVIMLAVGGLMCYHIDLVAQNESTNERLKGTYTLRRNPHNKGIFSNCFSFWCIPIRKSYAVAENKDDDLPLPLLHVEP